jgi:PBSX family phage portal protein
MRRERQREKKEAAKLAATPEQPADNAAPDASSFGAAGREGAGASPMAPVMALPSRVRMRKQINNFNASMGFVKGAGASNISDPYQGMYGKRVIGNIVEPPYDPQIMSLMQEHSTILRQCVDARVQNTVGFGWDLTSYPADEDKQDNAQAQAERNTMQSLFDYVNPFEDLTSLLSAVGIDVELTGNGYIEVVEGIGTPISELYRLPSTMTRMTTPDDAVTPYIELMPGPDGSMIQQPRLRHFRRFVQIETGGQKIWFKEFGDPRIISRDTGKPIDGSDDPAEIANEIIWHGHACTYSCYGIPLWVGHWLEMIGNRKADEINVDYFDKKGIPPMAILVSGGRLTKEAKRKLKHLIERKVKGSENFHEIIVLDTLPASTSQLAGESFANVRVDFKPLTQHIQKDALFKNYKNDNTLSIMSAFRTPPVIVGRSFDYNKATSIMAARVFENQVARPERNRLAKRLNRTVLSRMGIQHWLIHFLGANIQDSVEIVKALGPVQNFCTVAEVREAVADMRGVPVSEVADDIPEELLHTPMGLLDRLDMKPPDDGNDDDDAFKRRLKGWRDSNQIDAVTERKLRELQGVLEAEINEALTGADFAS